MLFPENFVTSMPALSRIDFTYCGIGDRIVWLDKAYEKLTVLSSKLLCHMEIKCYVGNHT